MRKLLKKYTPFLILIFLVLFMWLVEIFIVEGYASAYLHNPVHKILRFFIKGICAIIIFGTGYFGLSTLSVKWIKDLWLYWYAIALLAVTFRIILDVCFNNYFNYNILNFLSSIYYSNTTPFPYLFLWLLSIIVRQVEVAKKANPGAL